MKIITSAFFVALAAAHSIAGAQQPQSTSKTMSFEDCVKTIQITASQLGVAPINIVETNDVRMVRFRTADGSVLVTCSRVDRKMVITRSKSK